MITTKHKVISLLRVFTKVSEVQGKFDFVHIFGLPTQYCCFKLNTYWKSSGIIESQGHVCTAFSPKCDQTKERFLVVLRLYLCFRKHYSSFQSAPEALKFAINVIRPKIKHQKLLCSIHSEVFQSYKLKSVYVMQDDVTKMYQSQKNVNFNPLISLRSKQLKLQISNSSG